MNKVIFKWEVFKNSILLAKADICECRHSQNFGVLKDLQSNIDFKVLQDPHVLGNANTFYKRDFI